jgi:hypothetical protein
MSDGQAMVYLAVHQGMRYAKEGDARTARRDDAARLHVIGWIGCSGAALI